MKHANEREVGQIAHNSFFDAEKSCDRFRLRVKSEPLICCSIDFLVCQDRTRRNRHRSNIELTNDSHSRQASAEDHAPKQIETPPSCGLVPAAKSVLRTASLSSLTSYQNAGPVPAFLLRVQPLRTRRTGFISVSGQCAARSALSSDMRTKRISGGVAATEHLRAPMNSPTAGSCRAAGFPSLNQTLI
jgi:hypothetical protein